MENFERVSGEMLSYIKDKKTRMINLLMSRPGETRFILCGSSGSGKTRAVEEANKKLPEDKQIAESHKMLMVKDPSKAFEIFCDHSFYYSNSPHIGFNVVWKDVAKKLEEDHQIKVFWL